MLKFPPQIFEVVLLAGMSLVKTRPLKTTVTKTAETMGHSGSLSRVSAKRDELVN